VKIIVGLGNPGKEYEESRHNVGFDLIDRLAEAHRIKLDLRIAGVRALMGRGNIAGETVLLVKPQTYMNNSGEAVGALLRREEVALTDLLVISGKTDAYGKYANDLEGRLKTSGATVDSDVIPGGHDLGDADVPIIQQWLLKESQ